VNAPAVNLGSTPLRLPASNQMPRKLIIHWDSSTAKVMMFGAAGAPFMAEASAPHDQVRLRTHREEQTAELFVGLASFNLTESEAQIVAGTLGPRGMRFDR
jgi:hypothetical protein